MKSKLPTWTFDVIWWIALVAMVVIVSRVFDVWNRPENSMAVSTNEMGWRYVQSDDLRLLSETNVFRMPDQEDTFIEKDAMGMWHITSPWPTNLHIIAGSRPVVVNRTDGFWSITFEEGPAKAEAIAVSTTAVKTNLQQWPDMMW